MINAVFLRDSYYFYSKEVKILKMLILNILLLCIESATEPEISKNDGLIH